MFKKIILLVCSVCVLSIFSTTTAFSAVIDFDSTAPGVYTTLDYAGVTFMGVEDTSEGSTFLGLEVRDIYGERVLSTEYSDVHIIQATFDVATDFVQIENILDGDLTSEMDIITMSAFDAGGTLLATATQNLGDSLLSISMAGIAYVQLNDVAGSWGNGYVIDNFTFNESAPVPEPATMVLFGIGLLGLAGFSRKKS